MNTLADLLHVRCSADADKFFPDVMTDIETTSTDPQHGGVLQIAAVKFNYATGEIGPIFNRCLDLPPNRYWSESTREWWYNTNRQLLAKIIAKGEDPMKVMNDYYDFARSPDRPLRFWSRGSFDYNFIESYLNQFCLPMPHRFYEARELRSFIAGLHHTASEPRMPWITAPGEAHDALHDCVVQLKTLFAARDGNWHDVQVLPPEGATQNA